MTAARATFAPPAANTLGWGSVIAAVAASTLWSWVIINDWSYLAAYGALCGEASFLLGHCPACLPAVALTLLAAGLALTQCRRARSS